MKGVFSVGRLSVVRQAHKMSGSSSTHFPLAYSNFFFKAVSKILFVVSAYPLLWGYHGVEYKFWILSSEQKFRKAMLSNCGPLSAMIA